MPVRTNIVSGKKLREVQLNTLKVISDTISASFGPMGSNTLILKDGAMTKYSKDGFTLLKEMKMLGVIEEAVRSDLEDILRNIIKEFGDNSTSASILAYLLFDELCNMQDEEFMMPFTIINNFKKAVENINAKIMERGKPCTPDVMYDIAYTSTNGNELLASTVKSIYEKYPMDVHIDVSTSTNSDFMIKELDGLTLETGFMDTCFINNKSKNTATIRRPRIYYFEDPIDTPEMAGFFDRIIGSNIIDPINNHSEPEPTVILCPKLSRDFSSTIESIVSFMYQNEAANRPPLLVVTNIYDTSVVNDIIHLCGCPAIKKYIDPKNQEMDVANGKAPDMVTITQFYGTADEVVSSSTETRFVNPSKMYLINDDLERVLAPEYTALVEFLENEIARQKAEGSNVNEIGLLIKRLNALKANLVELYVGGISAAERDSYKDLIEDAILNCRSAAKYGYGYGANYEGLVVSGELLDETACDDVLYPYYDMIHNAYAELTKILYATVFTTDTAYDIMDKSLEEGCPYNLRTDKFDGKVITSIRSDVAVLSALSKVMTIMFTCNQALLQNPMVNNYEID